MATTATQTPGASAIGGPLLRGEERDATLAAVRKLIVNADDFGMTQGINRAIVEAYDAGIVTSATLMANSEAFDEALELAERRPGLRVGCHVVLVEGRPLTDPSQVSSLLDPHRQMDADGPLFRSSLANFARAATRGFIKHEHVITETVAQIRKLQAAGIQVSHVDCHKHAHMFPRIAEAVIEGARLCGVSTIRAPFEPGWAVSAGRSGGFQPRLMIRSFQVTLLRRWYGPFRRMVRAAGMRTTDGTVGIAVTGVLDQRSFARLVEHMPEGTFEFVCHPGYNDADLARVDTGLLASREVELGLLTSAGTRRILDERGVQLINFGDLH